MDDYTSDSDCKTSTAQSNGLQFGAQFEQDRQEIAQLQIDLDAYRSQWEVQQHVVIERHLSLLDTLQRQVVELESKSYASDSDQVVTSSSDSESHTRQFRVLEQRLEQAVQLSDQHEKTITSLCSEIERLKTEETSPSEAIDESVNDHPWQRRYELALEDLQELRQHNQTLTEKLEQAAVTAGTQPSDTSDWESMKQRLLSELEDGDASTQHSQEEQTSLKNSMEIMDEIVLEKDDEIRELQRMLSEQTAIHASAEVSHGPSADDQEAVSNEPSDLQQLQSQWREKLGQAEVELATERAKISRDRNEIADQFAELQTERRRLEEFSASFSDPDLDSPKSKRVGRWFARLGLHHPEE